MITQRATFSRKHETSACVLRKSPNSRIEHDTQTPFTRYKRLSNRLFNRLCGLTTVVEQPAASCKQTFEPVAKPVERLNDRIDNRLYRVNGVSETAATNSAVAKGRDGPRRLKSKHELMLGYMTADNHSLRKCVPVCNIDGLLLPSYRRNCI